MAFRRWPLAAGLSLLLTAAALTTAVGAQQDEARFDAAFDAAMEQEAPEFRPQRRRPSGRPREDGERRWTTDETTIAVRYFVRESPEAASKRFNEMRLMISIGTRPFRGHGDESFLVRPTGREYRLWFRQGAAILEVTAPDLDSVRRFAWLFGAVVAAHPPP